MYVPGPTPNRIRPPPPAPGPYPTARAVGGLQVPQTGKKANVGT